MKSAMLSHMRYKHEKTRPFSCSIDSCDYTATRKADLKHHLLKHNGIKTHCCSLCDAKFYHNYRLKSHIQVVHEGKPKKKKKLPTEESESQKELPEDTA